MSTAQRKILNLLVKKDISIKEISEITGYSTSGIRGRISELRDIGYTIITVGSFPKKYRLIFDKDDLAKKILDLVERRRMYGKRLEYAAIARVLRTDQNQVEAAMQKIHKHGMLIQLSNGSAMIVRKV